MSANDGILPVDAPTCSLFSCLVPLHISIFKSRKGLSHLFISFFPGPLPNPLLVLSSLTNHWGVPMKSFFLLLVVASMFAGIAQANIPLMMSYQGKITDSGGSPVADGTYTMRFRIYDDATAGTLQWDSGNLSVLLSDGVFSVLLCESPQPALTLYFDEDYWLLVTFDGDNQSPRQQLASVGYAYMASGLVPGTLIEGSVSTVTSSAIKAINTATSGTRYGGVFQTDASEGRAIYGFASHSSGQTYGGKFHSHSTSGIGVYGKVEATSGYNYGVYGESASMSGIGVHGYADATTGTTYGVYACSASTAGRGVFGLASTLTGSTIGGCFYTFSSSGCGVKGVASNSSGTNYGVYGESNSPSGYGVYYSGGIGGSGLMNSVVMTSQGPTSLDVHTTAGNWVEDFGEGQLINGQSHIDLDPLFLETVTIDDENPMKVFVTLSGRCRGVYVERGSTGFDVIEQDNGTSNVGLCYRVVAKRKGFEEKRLDYCKAAKTDSYLYPELREKKMREHEEELVRLKQERLRMEEQRARIADERVRE